MVLMMALTTGGEAPAFCHGCWGGCHGCYGGGCWGGCHGCYGGGYGCGGCYGGGYGGCCGGGYGGCCGGGCYGGGCYGGGSVIYTQPAATPMKIEKKAELNPNAATIVVSLPADAKLSIDDTATKATGATRTFATPTLEKGKDFHYTLKAEVVRNGQTLTTTKQVAVQAGRETRISIDDMTPATGVAAK